jgi:ribosomal protein L37AE/L43A
MFRWSPKDETVYYLKTADPALLLHEVAHAILHHTDYTRDIDLLKMERDAWELASAALSEKYGVDITSELKEDMLDTYRNWLHKRSICPECQATGVQTASSLYNCLACKTSWRVNEARSCALRRYKTI